jgi:uncharacterized protein YkwD
LVPPPLRAGALLALLGAALAFPTAARAAACPDADLLPDATNLARVHDALLCLANQARAERGRAALTENARLRRAATGHSADEVREGYYSHTSADGHTFAERILAAGYVHRRDSYVLGEDLAWSAGELSSPKAVVAAWLRTPTQRANLLDRTFRDCGIGVQAGVPTDPSVGATYTVDFGLRR